MRRTLLMTAAALLAAVLIPLTPASSGAQATTDVYVVHGANNDGQDAQGDGGTEVTVCADGEPLFTFEFGDVEGPLPLPTGETLALFVYLGTACEGIGFAADITPEGEAMAVVATATQVDDPEQVEDRLQAVLQPFELDVTCTDAGLGRLTGAHAALAGEVDLLLDGAEVTSIAFGEQFGAALATDVYSVAVEAGGNPVVGPADVAVGEQLATTIFVVGGLPVQGSPTPAQLEPELSPFVPLFLDIPVERCETPIETTTTTAAAPAAVTAARPTFTG